MTIKSLWMIETQSIMEDCDYMMIHRYSIIDYEILRNDKGHIFNVNLDL